MGNTVSRSERIVQLIGRFLSWCVGLVIALTILVTIPMLVGGMADSLPRWINLAYTASIYFIAVALMVGDLCLFAWKGESVWQWLRGFQKISSALAAIDVSLDRAANATLAVIGILVLSGWSCWHSVACLHWPKEHSRYKTCYS